MARHTLPEPNPGMLIRHTQFLGRSAKGIISKDRSALPGLPSPRSLSRKGGWLLTCPHSRRLPLGLKNSRWDGGQHQPRAEVP